MNFKRVMLWFYRLSWKKLTGLLSLALIIAIVPFAMNMANSPTRTRSEAALINKPQPITKEFVTPKGPPAIYLVDHFFGKAGDAVLVHGDNLGGFNSQTSVSVAGQVVPEDNLVSWTNDYIEFKLPDSVRSGKVSVNILGKQAEWPGMFWVIDANTTAEVRLDKINDQQARLIAKGINASQGLLLWILVYQGDDKTIDITPVDGIGFDAKTMSLPLGLVYELNLKFTGSNDWVSLATITKKSGQQVGIARAEAIGINLPIKSHPLFVSF